MLEVEYILAVQRVEERGLMSMHGCEPGCSSHSDTPTLCTVHQHCGVQFTQCTQFTMQFTHQHTHSVVHTVHSAVHTVTHPEPNTSTVPLAKCNVQLGGRVLIKSIRRQTLKNIG